MFSRKSLVIILVLLIGSGLFFAVQSSGLISNPVSKYEKILQLVGDMLETGHYSPKRIDDSFSKEIFKKYLRTLDADKDYFLQADIDELKKFETKIDDEIHGSKLESFYAINETYKKRLNEAVAIYKEILEKPFDFSIDESFNTDADKEDYPKDEAALRDVWRKKLKYMVLSQYADLKEEDDANKNKKDYKAKSEEELEEEARNNVMRIMDRSFDRLNNRYKDEDRFNLFVNDITESMDPHTSFFPPVEKRSFDEQMSGRFFGIGASLREDDGLIKIGTIITGSPAWKTGEIQVGDIILKVAQGKEEPQDLTGFAVTDAVQIIRGKKGTEVRLTLRKADGTVKVVPIIRDEIVLEETFAKSAIINQGDEKIGYIYLPEFYADFERPNGARCAIDVAKEVLKLKENNVDGIVLDLRNNGGGSLYDVVQMVGLFIEDGPVVQVKSRDENPSVLRDRDKSVLYDGPFAVMVNEFSASASEIFAAAIQDYNRGVIIGSSSTYGKGTVQRNIELEKTGLISGSTGDIGTIKLTLQKFYRVNGGSTQLKGITPDIILPDQYEYLKLREKDNEDALPWDEIQKTSVNKWNPKYSLQTLQKNSEARVKNSPAFTIITNNTEWLSNHNDKVVSLQLQKFMADQESLQGTYRQLSNLNRSATNLDVQNLPQDVNEFNADTSKAERNKVWLKNLKQDIHLEETVNVMHDMIVQSSLVKK